MQVVDLCVVCRKTVNGPNKSFRMDKAYLVHDACIYDALDWVSVQMNRERLDKLIEEAEHRTGWISSHKRCCCRCC